MQALSCKRCDGLMYKPFDDLGLRCFQCGRSTLTRMATEADAKDSINGNRAGGMMRYLFKLQQEGDR